MIIIYLLLAIIPSILIGYYLYKKDLNKEPKSLLIKLFFGGIGAAFLTFILSSFANKLVPGIVPTLDGTVEYNIIELFIKVILGVALIEEFSKWFFSYYIGYKSKEFDEIYDIILYCGFVALGFATFENVLYVLFSDNNLQTALLRAVTAVPGHVCDAVLMGYYLGIARQYEAAGNVSLRKKYIILSVAIPMGTHGIYDFLIMSGSAILVLVWFAFLVVMYIYVIKKLKQVIREKKRVPLPVSNMPVASIYFSQSNNYRPSYTNSTFGANSMYNNNNNSNPTMTNNVVMNNNLNNSNVNQNINNQVSAPVQGNFQIKYCPKCGKYEPDANFCSQCGSKIR